MRIPFLIAFAVGALACQKRPPPEFPPCASPSTYKNFAACASNRTPNGCGEAWGEWVPFKRGCVCSTGLGSCPCTGPADCKGLPCISEECDEKKAHCLGSSLYFECYCTLEDGKMGPRTCRD